MKFSVIIPAYNAKDYIGQLLDDLWNQTCRDFEIIVVDDGSTDCTGQIVEAYKKIYSHGTIPLRVLHKIQNEGLSMARNTGMEVAEGDYLLFLDADDSVEANLLEKVQETLKGQNIDLLVYGYTEDYYRKEQMTYQVKKSPQKRMFGKQGGEPLVEAYPYIARLEQDTMFGYAWNKVYRSEFLKKHKILYETVAHIEDVLFNFLVVEKMESMAVIPDMLYHYRNQGQERLTGKYLSEYFALQKRRYQLFLQMQKKKLNEEKQSRKNMTNQRMYEWERLVKETMAAAYFRSFQSYLVREIAHKTSKKEILTLAEKEMKDELFRELQFYLPDSGKMSKWLLKPLTRKKIKTSYRRAKLIYQVQRMLPGLYVKLKQNR